MVTRLQAHKTNVIQTRSTITDVKLFHHKASHTKQWKRRTNIRAGGAKPPVIIRTFKLNNMGSGSSLHTRT
jgi:hypothetical protein